jgi:hypothetical protein
MLRYMRLSYWLESFSRYFVGWKVLSFQRLDTLTRSVRIKEIGHEKRRTEI